MIPVGPKDRDFVHHIIPHIQQNALGLHKIYIVTAEKHIEIIAQNTQYSANNIHFVPEETFPQWSHRLEQHGVNSERVGWYVQQLIKLYAGLYIPHLMNRYVVWDADTFLMRPMKMFANVHGGAFFCTTGQYHLPYFKHMNQLHPQLKRVRVNESGICNFMPMFLPFVQELFDFVKHNQQKLFDEVFIDSIDIRENSGASEFEIYYNYLLTFHPDKVHSQMLTMDNSSSQLPDKSANFDIISVHWYRRGSI